MTLLKSARSRQDLREKWRAALGKLGGSYAFFHPRCIRGDLLAHSDDLGVGDNLPSIIVNTDSVLGKSSTGAMKMSWGEYCEIGQLPRLLTPVLLLCKFGGSKIAVLSRWL